LPAGLLHKTRSLLRFSNNRHRNGRRGRDARGTAEVAAGPMQQRNRSYYERDRSLQTGSAAAAADASLHADQTSKSLVAAIDFNSRDSADAQRFD
jgi:hypothetical protein